jgi:hypothetical protein
MRHRRYSWARLRRNCELNGIIVGKAIGLRTTGAHLVRHCSFAGGASRQSRTQPRQLGPPFVRQRVRLPWDHSKTRRATRLAFLVRGSPCPRGCCRQSP